MTIGAGIFLIAVGAILKFATNFHVQGVSIDTVGLILMIAGAAGLLLGLFQEIVWSRRTRPGGPRRGPAGRRTARSREPVGISRRGTEQRHQAPSVCAGPAVLPPSADATPLLLSRKERSMISVEYGDDDSDDRHSEDYPGQKLNLNR